MSAISFTLESSFPFDCTIRSAVPYFRPRIDATDVSDDIFAKINAPKNSTKQLLRDIILCTTDTGELVVVDWDLGRDAIPEVRPALGPGLRAVNRIRQSRPGKDTNSLGRFIKLSKECVSLFQIQLT